TSCFSQTSARGRGVGVQRGAFDGVCARTHLRVVRCFVRVVSGRCAVPPTIAEAGADRRSAMTSFI
ncbi:unnamed protein product, partial [Pelagomonas calceolata]